QIALRMRNRNFGMSNDPIKRHCDSSSTTKFELARLLPLAVPITNGRTNGRTHIRKLIEGEKLLLYALITARYFISFKSLHARTFLAYRCATLESQFRDLRMSFIRTIKRAYALDKECINNS